ncbi:hypothetical protein KbCgl_24530 [Corynebacterium glutamicum]|nr:hypothetical protein KbCgl_24530 [Corynebacterium glutamicum]
MFKNDSNFGDGVAIDRRYGPHLSHPSQAARAWRTTEREITMTSVFDIFQSIFDGVQNLVGSIFAGAQGVFDSIVTASS